MAAGKSRRWYLEIKTMQVNLPVLLINIPHTIGFQPIAPPSTEQSVHVVLLSLLDECAGAAPHALTGLRPVCGRVARRQNFYLEPSIVTAVGGFFVRISSGYADDPTVKNQVNLFFTVWITSAVRLRPPTKKISQFQCRVTLPWE